MGVSPGKRTHSSNCCRERCRRGNGFEVPLAVQGHSKQAVSCHRCNVGSSILLGDADAGVYTCVLSNGCGTATSSGAALTIVCRNLADVASIGGSVGCDAQLTADDIIVYLDRFFANNLAVADLVGLGGTGGPDGQVTTDDLIAFLAAFFAGCL